MNHLLHMKQWEDAIRPCLFYLAFCDFSSLERQFRPILYSLRCSDIVSRICYSGLSGLSGRHRFAFLSDQKREISLEQKKNDNCHNCQNREKQVRAFWWRGVHAEKSFSNQGVFPIIRKRRLFRKRCFASAPFPESCRMEWRTPRRGKRVRHPARRCERGAPAGDHRVLPQRDTSVERSEGRAVTKTRTAPVASRHGRCGAAARAGRPGGQASRPTAKPHERRAHGNGAREAKLRGGRGGWGVGGGGVSRSSVCR